MDKAMHSEFRELILKIPVDASNLNHIAKSGQINGSLLVSIENILTQHAKKTTDELFVERHLVKVKQKEKECLQEENQSLRSELQKSRDYASLLEKEIIELQKQKELNAELVKLLSKLTRRVREMMIKMEYDPDKDEFLTGIESLIKKSKES